MLSVHQVGSLRRQEGSRRGRLRKSQSLDSDQTIDLKRQLEVVTQEANVLKEKVPSLSVLTSPSLVDLNPKYYWKI